MCLIFSILTLPDLSDFCLQIVDVINGLGYLHVYGIIHSDLKGVSVLWFSRSYLTRLHYSH